MKLLCNRIRLGAVCILAYAAAAAETRTVTGRVLTSDGEAVRGAVVQLKNTRTLQIRSFISQDDGSYHFASLNPDVDYEIYARYRGRSSRTKTVSQFDSDKVVRLDLVLGNEPQT
jgi:protocatechuate 3,4-dioxygenase beta subunit